MIYHTTSHRTANRGTALLEFIICIPLMAVLIAGIFFFGWVMRNQQRMRIADRYASWKSVHSSTPSTQDINEQFFADRGDNIQLDFDTETSTRQVRYKFVEAFSDSSAGLYVQNLVDKNLPGGSHVFLESEFTTNNARWRQWAESGGLQHSHVRDGRYWIRGETQMPLSIRDIYLHELDDFVTGFPTQASTGADLIQSLYLGGW